MAKPIADLAATLAACRANEARDLDDLRRLLRQPSISAQNIGVAECADLVLTTLRDAGITARLLPTPAHPVVYGEWTGAPGKPTVLIYGHYDVQPPEPLDEWLEPAVRADRPRRQAVRPRRRRQQRANLRPDRGGAGLAGDSAARCRSTSSF